MNKSMPWQPPMSLTEEPMHGAPHAATLLNDDTRVVKQDFTTLGHLFINPTINIDGGSAILGNLDVSHDPQPPLEGSSNVVTPPSLVSENSDPNFGSPSPNPNDFEHPRLYRPRPADWFTAGRIFNIWAPKDIKLHEEKFVLLDTKNNDGLGLLLRVYTEREEEFDKGYFHRSHVLVDNFESSASVPNKLKSQSKEKIVFMDQYSDVKVEEHTYIELGQQYNVLFSRYPCIDRGVLDRSSLKHLQRCYLKWLEYDWNC